MNKKVKKVLIFISFVVIFILLDFVQVSLFNSKPILYIEKDIPYGKVHKSFLMDVYYCDNGEEEKVYVESKKSDFTCPVKISKKDFVVVDESENCKDKLEYVYEDNYYKYYFKCKKSDKVFIKLDTDVKFPVKEALERELVTVSELEREGLEFYKEKK